VSHELRTPLNAILGYTELIADGIYGQPSEKMLTVLRRLESNGKHLLGLINVRGRDGRYRPPPAQNRASGIPARGSHLGCVTAKRVCGHG
jgi:His Kinase A (phospho-acceptor) domain